MCGNFNEILYLHEKRGGQSRDQCFLNDFHVALAMCDLEDVGYNGYRYTRSNGRSGDMNIQECLDTFVANSEWCDMYPDFKVRYQPPDNFDNVPILLIWDISEGGNGTKKKLSRFEAMWTRENACER